MPPDTITLYVCPTCGRRALTAVRIQCSGRDLFHFEQLPAADHDPAPFEPVTYFRASGAAGVP